MRIDADFESGAIEVVKHGGASVEVAVRGDEAATSSSGSAFVAAARRGGRRRSGS